MVMEVMEHEYLAKKSWNFVISHGILLLVMEFYL